jgi:two-component system, cell cycle sensor histidine kinase and response regulator CckA
LRDLAVAKHSVFLRAMVGRTISAITLKWSESAFPDNNFKVKLAASRAHRNVMVKVKIGSCFGERPPRSSMNSPFREDGDGSRMAMGLPIEKPPEGGDEITHATPKRATSQANESRAAQAELELRVAERTAELSAVLEKLRQATELNEAVVRSSPLAIIVYDLEGKVTFWNPGAEKMFGWKEVEILGRHPPIVPPEQQAESDEWFKKFATGWSVESAERKRRRKDGTLFDVAIWTAPLRDAKGKIRGTVSVGSDISQQRLLEEQFRQSQKMEAVGRLAGGVAHDFNNLLTVISGYTEMLVAAAQDAPGLLKYAQEIQQAAGRASSLTHCLLTFSRRQPSQPRIFNLGESVNNDLGLLRRVIGEEIKVVMQLAPDLGRISADPGQVDQVIMNLVVNARDAMQSGGVLTIKTANVWLDRDYSGHRVFGVQPGPYVMLAISDTGTGMTAETRSRLFEPFFTTKAEGKGTGLGLSIIYGIVKQNGGEIIVYSEPGKGATFEIFFPAIDTPAELTAAEAETIVEPGAGTILICEDEESIRALVDTMLTTQGYHVIQSESPQHALELLRESDEPVDLLLTDVGLPQMSGFALAREARVIRPKIKVIFISGYTGGRFHEDWDSDENVPMLAKPFTAAALNRMLHQVL